MSKQLPPAAIASAIGPCRTIFQIVGRPCTEGLPETSHHPTTPDRIEKNKRMKIAYRRCSLVGLQGCALSPNFCLSTCHEPSIKSYCSVRIDFIFCCYSNQNCWPAEKSFFYLLVVLFYNLILDIFQDRRTQSFWLTNVPSGTYTPMP